MKHHLINGTGKMKQCDFHPKHSVQETEIDENGFRWTHNGRVAIHPDIGSEICAEGLIVKKCYNCGLGFTKDAVFVGKECTRCYERKNVVGRT